MPRPWLSAAVAVEALLPDRGVAGVDAPALVERTNACGASARPPSRIAGVDAPALVERWSKPKRSRSRAGPLCQPLLRHLALLETLSREGGKETVRGRQRPDGGRFRRAGASG